jgi:hypothetical protein
MFVKSLLFGTAGVLTALVQAQFPPKPEGVTVLQSQVEEGVRISYKEVHVYQTLQQMLRTD